MLPAGGFIEAAQNVNASVLSYQLPVPYEVVYEDSVNTLAPSLLSSDKFGQAQATLSVRPGFPVRFSVTLRLNFLHDVVLADRVE